MTEKEALLEIANRARSEMGDTKLTLPEVLVCVRKVYELLNRDDVPSELPVKRRFTPFAHIAKMMADDGKQT